jgi:hypothetical protein
VYTCLEQEPGPNNDSRTGSRKRPWRKPSTITRKIILKNVMKMYDGAITRPEKQMFQLFSKSAQMADNFLGEDKI